MVKSFIGLAPGLVCIPVLFFYRFDVTNKSVDEPSGKQLSAATDKKEETSTDSEKGPEIIIQVEIIKQHSPQKYLGHP